MEVRVRNPVAWSAARLPSGEHHLVLSAGPGQAVRLVFTHLEAALHFVDQIRDSAMVIGAEMTDPAEPAIWQSPELVKVLAKQEEVLGRSEAYLPAVKLDLTNPENVSESTLRSAGVLYNPLGGGIVQWRTVK